MQGWGWLHHRFPISGSGVSHSSWQVCSWLAGSPRGSKCPEAQMTVSDQGRNWHMERARRQVSDGNLNDTRAHPSELFERFWKPQLCERML